MIRVILAEDHALVRQGIRALLERASDIEVIAEASDGQEAVELVERLAPDVLVLDIAMPRLHGLQAVERVTALGADTRVIVLSMYSDEMLVRETLRKGAVGYLPKRSVGDELLIAIRAARRGEVYLSPAVARPLVAAFCKARSESDVPSERDLLTSREQEVLQLVVEGHTNHQIAEMVGVGLRTVERDRANLMSKLRVNNLPELMLVAIESRLVFPIE
jgi:DNA-binding NarL/FixJ family response regulator